MLFAFLFPTFEGTKIFFMKKPLLHLLILSFLFMSVSVVQIHGQNLNVTLADKLAYSGQGLANIGSWKDPQDGKEYALVGAANGLSIVDVSNPSNVTQIVQIPGPNCSWYEVKVNGNYAYVTTECGPLQIINLTNLPGTNLQTTTWSPTIGGTKLQKIHALHIDNGKVYLYGSNVGKKGAIIADITTDPMVPVYLGSWDTRYIHDGYVRNDTLYACHIFDGDCEVVNLKNPAAGVALASFKTPHNFTHNSWLTYDSKACLTTDEKDDTFLASYDVSNLNNVTEIDRIQSNPGGKAVVHNTHIVRKNEADFAVTSWYKDGITIVDASRPHNLVQVGNYDTSPSAGGGMSGCWGVDPFLPSGTIVASDISAGLFVLTPTYVRASFLEGVVSCNGTLVAGAQIKLLNPPASNVNSATDLTDALGKYGVGVVTPGTYSVTISKSGYTSQTVTASLTTGNVTVLNVNLCVTGINELSSGNGSVEVYPNPFSARTEIQVSGFENNQDLSFTLYDIHGKEVRHETIEKQITRFDRGDLTDGVYFYAISDGKGTTNTGKIVIE